MLNLTKLEFISLDISENNYLSEIIDAEIHQAINLGETIKVENNTSLQDTVPLPQKYIGMGSNIYSIIYEEQLK
jgi:hypothetical protein